MANDTVDMTYDEAIQWLQDHYNHDGRTGDRVMDLCIQTLWRVREIEERYDLNNWDAPCAAEVVDYLVRGEDWE